MENEMGAGMMEEQGAGAPMHEGIEDMGRGTDSVMAHMSLGEVVIPRAFLDDENFRQVLEQYFQAQGTDINEFTVGHEANKINPETGYPEFFKIGKLFRKLAPVALSYFAPGIGSALGSTLSASTLGAIGGGLGGLVSGGGLKGAALGALGGYGLQGGFNDVLGNSGWVNPDTGLRAAGSGSGILGAIGDATGSTLSGLTGGLGGGSTFNVGSSIASALGGVADDKALKKAQQQLLAGNQQQLANIGSYNAGEYLNDPEYQNTLAESEKAINRSLGAQGGVFSGRALQAANENAKNINTDFQNRYYQKYLNRVNMQNPLYAGNANTQAQTGIARANNLGTTLASILNPQKSYSLEDLMKLGLA